MKRNVLIVLVTIAATCLAMAQEENAKSASQKKAGGAVQEEIKNLEQERNQAILHSDTAALDRLTSDDSTLIDADGKLAHKKQILDGFKSGAIKFDARELSDLDVRVYGNTVVVTGTVNQKSTQNGKDTSGESRFTRVYVKKKGHWVSVAQQVTSVAKR